MRESIPSLTGLRFVAAFCVVIAHALPKIIPLPQGDSPSALYLILCSVSAEGMTLFFVLSGFVIHYNYSDQIRHNGNSGLINFFIARFARLYPLFLCCLLYDLLSSYSYYQSPASLWEALPYYLSLTQSWFYVPLGNNSLVYQFGQMPSVAWSISTEWFFYCIYPFICYGLARISGVRANLITALAVCIVAVVLIFGIGIFSDQINAKAASLFGPIADQNTHSQDSFLRWLLYFSPYSRMFEFMLGCTCASIYLTQSGKTPTRDEQRWGLLALVIAIAFLFAQHVFFYAPHLLPAKLVEWLAPFRWLSLSFGMAPPIAIIIFCCARYRSGLSRWLSSAKIVLCGEASYSIYLLHLPVIFAFRWEAAPVTDARVLIADVLRFGMTALSIIGLSLITWTLIEMPSRKFFRRFMVNGVPAAVRKLAG